MRNAEDRRVTVLLAESGRSVGGTERVVWELATRLSPQRFDVRVWLSDDAGVVPRWPAASARANRAGIFERQRAPCVE